MWELVLPALERRHDVLALTLAGHAGGPPIDEPITGGSLADGVERAIDAAGIGTAHLVGNSLGGHVALQLAARGRARSVVALAPAGGWEGGAFPLRPAAPAARGARRGEGDRAARGRDRRDAGGPAPGHGAHRRRPRRDPRGAHRPPHARRRRLPRAADLLDRAAEIDWTLDAARIDCPVRMVWGTADRLLPWPAAAARFRRDWLPHADWVELEGVGHCPQLDVPLETAQLVLGLTG